jgi:hypothetical protein
MTDSPEFRGQYRSYYGRSYSPQEPDYTRCASSVTPQGGWFSAQCTRKNGHGPHGAWCKQHNPVAVKERQDARDKQWHAKWDADRRRLEFAAQCQAAIRQIAAGHNDPRGLAQEIIDRLEAP